MSKIAIVSVGLMALGVVGALPTAATAADIGVVFTETSVDGGPDTLTSSLAGVTIGGTTDDWTIDITSTGITLSSNDLPQQWVEGPGDSGVNVLQIDPLAANVLDLISEDTNPPGTPDNFCGTGAPIAEGISCFIGTDDVGNSYFATVVEQQVTSSPEPASLALLGAGLTALGAARRSRRR